MDELSGRVAVITGAASGIGLAMAHRLADEGMDLVLGDVDAPSLEAARAALADRVGVVAAVCDVSRAEDVDALRDLALGRFGGAHLVCNNAGVGSGGAMGTIPLADWEWVLGVNLWGVIHGVRAFLPVLQEQGEGHIVNTASVAGLVSAPFMGPYNVSKYGVVALSETLAVELGLAESPVGVSVLCPSWVKTRIASSGRNRPHGVEAPAGEPAVIEAIENFLVSGIEPDQVAEAVVEAVRSRRFWILTHGDTVPAVKVRTAAIVAGEDPPLLMH